MANDERRCRTCGCIIPANTSEIYDPKALNPRRDEPGQGFYLEECQDCAAKTRQTTIDTLNTGDE